MKYDITDILVTLIVIIAILGVIYLLGILTWVAFQVHFIWGILAILNDLLIGLILTITFIEN